MTKDIFNISRYIQAFKDGTFTERANLTKYVANTSRWCDQEEANMETLTKDKLDRLTRARRRCKDIVHFLIQFDEMTDAIGNEWTQWQDEWNDMADIEAIKKDRDFWKQAYQDTLNESLELTNKLKKDNERKKEA